MAEQLLSTASAVKLAFSRGRQCRPGHSEAALCWIVEHQLNSDLQSDPLPALLGNGILLQGLCLHLSLLRDHLGWVGAGSADSAPGLQVLRSVAER